MIDELEKDSQSADEGATSFAEFQQSLQKLCQDEMHFEASLNDHLGRAYHKIWPYLSDPQKWTDILANITAAERPRGNYGRRPALFAVRAVCPKAGKSQESKRARVMEVLHAEGVKPDEFSEQLAKRGGVKRVYSNAVKAEKKVAPLENENGERRNEQTAEGIGAKQKDDGSKGIAVEPGQSHKSDPAYAEVAQNVINALKEQEERDGTRCVLTVEFKTGSWHLCRTALDEAIKAEGQPVLSEGGFNNHALRLAQRPNNDEIRQRMGFDTGERPVH